MIVIGIILNYANMGTLALHSPSCFKFLASELRIKSKLNKKVKLKNGGCSWSAQMTSQLNNNFPASVAVHGADDITLLIF